MNKLLKIAVAASAALSFGAQADVLLDDFSQDQDIIQTRANNSGEIWGTSVFSSSILGGYRDISIEKLVAPTGLNNNNLGAVSAFVSQGMYTFSTDADVYAVGKIVWDGVNNASGGVNKNTGLGNADLAASANAFQLVVTAADLGFPFQIDVYTDDTHYSSFKTTALGPGNFSIPFACFIVNVCPGATLTTAGGGADFTKINAIVATVNVAGSTNSVDLRLDNVGTVPEPASVALVGAAMLGLGLARRRNAKK